MTTGGGNGSSIEPDSEMYSDISEYGYEDSGLDPRMGSGPTYKRGPNFETFQFRETDPRGSEYDWGRQIDRKGGIERILHSLVNVMSQEGLSGTIPTDHYEILAEVKDYMMGEFDIDYPEAQIERQIQVALDLDLIRRA